MIRLGELLKLAGVVGTGGEAKLLLASEEVRVNGEPESRRGRQLRAGDEALVGDEALRVAEANLSETRGGEADPAAARGRGRPARVPLDERELGRGRRLDVVDDGVREHGRSIAPRGRRLCPCHPVERPRRRSTVVGWGEPPPGYGALRHGDRYEGAVDVEHGAAASSRLGPG